MPSPVNAAKPARRQTPASDRAEKPAAMIALAAALTVLLLLYFDTAHSIVAIWNSSETFAHGYIILPISAWLIWKRRAMLQARPAAPFWSALILLLMCGSGWLLAELADVQVVRQYAFVAMLPCAVLVILGGRMAAAMAFPLAFMLLAVPFGEIFIAPLINVTADFTVWALQATGIPVLREGPNFSIPTGNWSVVEACSGVRYLIASFTLGCLYAYLTYRSLGRRLLFVLLSILVPIVANGARAYMIVMIGHLSGMELAVGVDHLIYGWVFFGLVMFLMFWLGGFWREDDIDVVPVPQGATIKRIHPPGNGRFIVAAAAVVLCVGIWPVLADQLSRGNPGRTDADLAGFTPTWLPAPSFAQWTPHFSKPNTALTQILGSGPDRAGLSVMYYRNRPRGAGLINSTNRLVRDKDPLWAKGPTVTRAEAIGSRTLVVRESELRGAGGAMLVWQWYWINGVFLENDYMGKLLQAKGKLLHRADDSAAVFAYAPLSEDPQQARALLRRFVTDNLTPLEAVLARSQTAGR